MVARYAKLAGFTIRFHASDLRNVYQSVPSEFATRNVATTKRLAQQKEKSPIEAEMMTIDILHWQ